MAAVAALLDSSNAGARDGMIGGLPVQAAERSSSVSTADPNAPADAATPSPVQVGGGFVFVYTQPLAGSAQPSAEIAEARLNMDARYRKRFGMHMTLLLRDTKAYDFFPGTAWVQEAYAFAEAGPLTLKAGKVFAQFGRFWDNSFYGNVQLNDGIKLDSDHGLSLEAAFDNHRGLSVGCFGQFFVVDGSNNYSVPRRDTVSIPGARRRNYVVGRLEPAIDLGGLATLKLGLSGSQFQADLPSPIGRQNVGRAAVDATLLVANASAWLEYTRQYGRHVTDFPFAGTPASDTSAAIPGRSAKQIDYVLIGGEYAYDAFALHYNFSRGVYAALDYTETQHVPGLSLSVDGHLFVLLEWAFVRARSASGVIVLDNALYFVIATNV